MPLPTETEIRTQIANVVDLLEDHRLAAISDSPNRVGQIDTITQSIEGPHAPAVLAGLAAVRAAIYAPISPERERSILGPLFMTYAQVRSLNAADPRDAIRQLRDDFHTRSESVKRRAFSFGSPSAGGSNVGTGTLNRLTKDWDAYDIEDQHADAKTFTCVQDEHSGATYHQEVFEARGASRSSEPDLIDLSASGRVSRIAALSAVDSAALLDNPSFDRFSIDGSSNLSNFPGWTAATGSFGTEIERDETNYYRDYFGAPDNVALKFAGNGKLTQDLGVRVARFDPLTPYYMQVAYNRQVGSGDGTLTIRLGGASKAVALSAQTGWNILRLDLNQNLWFPNWNAATLDVEIELSSRTTGTVLVDDVILAPMTKFDGAYYALVGGATRFLRDDLFTVSDSETGAKIQHHIWRAFGRDDGNRYGMYLPHSATPTWADP